MKNRFAILTGLVLSVAGLVSAVAEESIQLKQSFPVGKKIHQSMVINQTMKMSGLPGAPEGQGMNMKNKILMDMSMDIQKHEDDQKKAVIKYEKLGMEIDAGVFKQEFSSDSEDQNPFTAIAGKEVVVIYDKDDKVLSVEGAEKLLEDAAGQQPGAADMFAQMFSEDQMKETINQGLLQVVPEKPVKIGDSWPFSMETPMPQGMGKMKVSGTYTLKRFDDLDGQRCAVIAMEGQLESDTKGKIEMQGQEIEMEFGESDFEGDIYFDNELGLPRKSDMLTKMKMTMGLLGQKMEMDMSMTMINQITKVEASK